MKSMQYVRKEALKQVVEYMISL